MWAISTLLVTAFFINTNFNIIVKLVSILAYTIFLAWIVSLFMDK